MLQGGGLPSGGALRLWRAGSSWGLLNQAPQWIGELRAGQVLTMLNSVRSQAELHNAEQCNHSH
jgi:hypothetical protein